MVADTLERTKDAAEAITVTWEELPHVIGATEALKPDAPRIWQQRNDNAVLDMTLGDKAATERAFAEAVKIVALTLVNQRVCREIPSIRAASLLNTIASKTA